MRMKHLQISSLCAVAAVSTACSTIVEGTEQSVAVNTDPTGAECRLDRDGQTLGVVNPTPGSVTVSKGRQNINVFCSRDGFEDGAGTLPSEFQTMTIGNAVFGGIIGLGVDAASGAINEYPDSILVHLRREAEVEEQEPENGGAPMS